MQPQFITLPKQAKDLTNQKFYELTAIGPIGKTKRGSIVWLCKCDCGNYTQVVGAKLKLGDTKSCGCRRYTVSAKASITHGLSKHPLVNTWGAIVQRCTNPVHPRYNDYGGRGISICDEWRNDFKAFYDYVTNLPDYGREDYTLDRIDNDGNYEPGNVRWASRHQQRRNSRAIRHLTYNGKTQSLTEWAKELGMEMRTLHKRLKKGWTVERALSTPVRPMKPFERKSERSASKQDL